MCKLILLEAPEEHYTKGVLKQAEEIHSKRNEISLMVDGPSSERPPQMVADEILQYLNHVDYDYIYVVGWTIKDFIDKGYPLQSRYENNDFNDALNRLMYEAGIEAHLLVIVDVATNRLEGETFKRHDIYYRHAEFYKAAYRMQWRNYLNIDLSLLHGIRRLPSNVRLKKTHLK